MTANQPRDFDRIQPGSEVIGADNEKVGDVEEVQRDYLVISKGLIFTSERYIPFSAITDASGDAVYLNVTKNEIDERGWDTVPETTTQEAYEEPLGERPARTSESDTEHMELREEQLRARKETTQAGEVEVGKDVVSEEESMRVPREHEEVDVEYHPVEGGRTASGPVGEDEEVHMPIREEHIEAEKETRVTGEVDVSKRTEEETEEVSGEVRREKPRVERHGDVHGTEAEEERRD